MYNFFVDLFWGNKSSSQNQTVLVNLQLIRFFLEKKIYAKFLGTHTIGATAITILWVTIGCTCISGKITLCWNSRHNSTIHALSILVFDLELELERVSESQLRTYSDANCKEIQTKIYRSRIS